MRKAGVDAHTRRDIMGHETTSMDDRYTMIDDEALRDARLKMNRLHKAAGLLPESVQDVRAEIRRLQAILERSETPQDTPDTP